jgi:hypothetical protein
LEEIAGFANKSHFGVSEDINTPQGRNYVEIFFFFSISSVSRRFHPSGFYHLTDIPGPLPISIVSMAVTPGLPP